MLAGSRSTVFSALSNRPPDDTEVFRASAVNVVAETPRCGWSISGHTQPTRTGCGAPDGKDGRKVRSLPVAMVKSGSVPAST